jgi:hypothetical protein
LASSQQLPTQQIADNKSEHSDKDDSASTPDSIEDVIDEVEVCYVLTTQSNMWQEEYGGEEEQVMLQEETVEANLPAEPQKEIPSAGLPIP